MFQRVKMARPEVGGKCVVRFGVYTQIVVGVILNSACLSSWRLAEMKGSQESSK